MSQCRAFYWLRRGLSSFLSWQLLFHDPHNLHLLSIWDYRLSHSVGQNMGHLLAVRWSYFL
jgi:hypothetical protein